MNNETGAKSLRDLIDNKKFRIPMYQRNYKWNTDVAKKLAGDIVACFNEKEKGKEVKKSLGLITLYKDNNNEWYDVIDGQQRFTTLAILLSILGDNESIDLIFERDEALYNKRALSIKNKRTCVECTDVNRINRNREAMENVLINQDSNNIPKKDLATFILDNVMMLCSVVNDLPVKEFMNLNAYKTAFSICDHVRANLISLNSFHKKELENKDTAAILARCLSNHSYKTAVAILYNNILEKLYDIEEKDGTYKSIYELLKKPEDVIINPEKESRINILFNGMLKKNAQNYESGEITENLDYWIKMLQKLAFVNKLLDELKDEFDRGEFHSFKQIDDYQKLTKKSFIREVFDEIDNKWDSQTLAKEIQKYSNVDSVIIKCINEDSKKLANRYLEAFVHSDINLETYKKADNEKTYDLPMMKLSEVNDDISSCGQFIINRYELEHREDLNVYIDIPPVLDLEDRENINFGGSLDLGDADEISVGNLFNNKIKIPVIQRDYCMGARITGENDFLAFLLDGYKNETKLSASTVLLSVSEADNGKKEIYIFDGQQRTFTLYNILKYCGEQQMNDYLFVGREANNPEKNYSSPYSKESVKNLKRVLDEKKMNETKKKGFAEYIKRNVFLKVKIVNSVSGAEQFFMDINGGVALKKYEIYKAILCNRLSKLKKEDVVRKIENEWLDYFYRYRNQYLKVSDIKNNQEDEEELLEIRFIEYVCRFVYRMNHFGMTYRDVWVNNNETDVYSQQEDIQYDVENNSKEDEYDLLSFDEIESKGEIVAKLGYLCKLEKNDVEQIEKIIDSVTKIKVDCDNEELEVILNIRRIDTNSTGGYVLVCRMEQEGDKESVLNKNGCFLKRFIWSLQDNNREILKSYYRYKNVGSLIKIYDDDQIMRDILLSIINNINKKVHGGVYPYQLCWEEEEPFTIFRGYNDNNNSGTCQNPVKEIIIKNKYVKEIPAYYYKDIIKIKDMGNVIRLQYLQEKAGSNGLYFALVINKVKKQIEYEDGTNSNICLLKEKITDYPYINRTEAYCLKNISKYIVENE